MEIWRNLGDLGGSGGCCGDLGGSREIWRDWEDLGGSWKDPAGIPTGKTHVRNHLKGAREKVNVGEKEMVRRITGEGWGGWEGLRNE